MCVEFQVRGDSFVTAVGGEMEKETEDKSSQTTPTQSCHQHSCQPHQILFCAFCNALMPHLPSRPLLPFDFNNYAFQSPLFNPPVGFLSVHSVWFQSPLRLAQLPYPPPPFHTFFFLSPHFPPHSAITHLFKGVLFTKKCNGGRRPLGQERGCKKRGAGER